MSERRFSRVGWAIPSAPKRATKPSWMGIPAVEVPPPPSVRAVVPSAAPPPPSSGRPPVSQRPATLPPPSISFKKVASVAPPAISTMRELELESEVTLLKAEIARLADALACAREKVLADSEAELVRLAVTIAERVVARELDVDPTIILPWIREGIRMLPGNDITVAIAPDIAEHIGADELHSELPKAKRVIVDGSLPPGAVEVREGNGMIEVGADARLAAMSDALGVDGVDR